METPRSEQFDDIYFQIENGLEESRYVFLEKNSLPQRFSGKDQFTICETGFGTGLNFLCAWKSFEDTADAGQILNYISFEKYPLSKDDIARYLAHWTQEFEGRLERLVDLYPLRIGGWHKIRVSAQVTLTLIFDDVNRAIPELDAIVDCWFLDGHAPAKNPEMWSDTVFSNMGRLSREGARVATFTAAGIVKRGLEGAGFHISKTKGYGRKREMIVGTFEGDRGGDDSVIKPQSVAVIGGGIAGVAAASSLHDRGIEVHVYEKNGLASGGSGNVRGLFNPRFTAQRGFESDFYSSAFMQALRVFQGLDEVGFDPCGSLHLVGDDQKQKRFDGFLGNWDWHQDHARLVSREEAGLISGVPVKHDALYLPDAGMVSPYRVVAALAQKVSVVEEEVLALQQSDSQWLVNGRIYDAVVLACAADVLKFSQTQWLPVHTVRGQVSVIQVPDSLGALACNLCYGGYASHPFEGKMVVGSTFQSWLDDLSIREEDHADVLSKLSSVVEGFDGAADICDARAAFRCSAKDRVPVIGALPEYHGLYVSVAHGSHGLTSSVLAAEIIAAQMMGESSPVPRNVLACVSAQRFIDRAARKNISLS
ncbi:MAG: bifunctional tRNA (5-methylaminomethyl-2-thiouridine)(34)-methyltransferase MnmD/FAD-dependent 5-carboxymethylaminomethyl-2-thiouridine(34) oxidoreductase MnmC [Alphaproteobacteria bacterium]|nr:bifunctional tRNA (5-methylaminomethyl-2-thiouridine)(34)-methyltransferase MnmD/FAD-dependent 5-carboxymethylaminomethyl-2-thiouridine(34) oxidoreductase MnmC [Alphaproteobacteria bacterium]